MFDFSIGFYGSTLGIGTTCGYGYVAVNLIKAWQHYFNVPVWWGDSDAPVAFSFTQPSYYEYDNKDRINIGYTPWESTSLPDTWKFYMNKMTEIWTTSNACKEWYRINKIEVPINVLRHGINRKHFPAVKRELNGGPFIFLHIGAEAKRKGADIVHKAFGELFGNDPNYKLILKGNPPWDTEYNNVKFIREYLTQEQMTDLYLSSHAMIYPTFGEGFGLIPFQAAASGMPTAVTNWGGCKDYIFYCWPINIEGLIKTSYEPHVGLWAQPDIDSVKDNMIRFATQSEYYFEMAYKKANMMDENWSWKSVANDSLQMMDRLLKKS